MTPEEERQAMMLASVFAGRDTTRRYEVPAEEDEESFWGEFGTIFSDLGISGFRGAVKDNLRMFGGAIEAFGNMPGSLIGAAGHPGQFGGNYMPGAAGGQSSWEPPEPPPPEPGEASVSTRFGRWLRELADSIEADPKYTQQNAKGIIEKGRAYANDVAGGVGQMLPQAMMGTVGALAPPTAPVMAGGIVAMTGAQSLGEAYIQLQEELRALPEYKGKPELADQQAAMLASSIAPVMASLDMVGLGKALPGTVRKTFMSTIAKKVAGATKGLSPRNAKREADRLLTRIVKGIGRGGFGEGVTEAAQAGIVEATAAAATGDVRAGERLGNALYEGFVGAGVGGAFGGVEGALWPGEKPPGAERAEAQEQDRAKERATETAKELNADPDREPGLDEAVQRGTEAIEGVVDPDRGLNPEEAAQNIEWRSLLDTLNDKLEQVPEGEEVDLSRMLGGRSPGDLSNEELVEATKAVDAVLKSIKDRDKDAEQKRKKQEQLAAQAQKENEQAETDDVQRTSLMERVNAHREGLGEDAVNLAAAGKKPEEMTTPGLGELVKTLDEKDAANKKEQQEKEKAERQAAKDAEQQAREKKRQEKEDAEQESKDSAEAIERTGELDKYKANTAKATRRKMSVDTIKMFAGKRPEDASLAELKAANKVLEEQIKTHDKDVGSQSTLADIADAAQQQLGDDQPFHETVGKVREKLGLKPDDAIKPSNREALDAIKSSLREDHGVVFDGDPEESTESAKPEDDAKTGMVERTTKTGVKYMYEAHVPGETDAQRKARQKGNRERMHAAKKSMKPVAETVAEPPPDATEEAAGESVDDMLDGYVSGEDVAAIVKDAAPEGMTLKQMNEAFDAVAPSFGHEKGKSEHWLRREDADKFKAAISKRFESRVEDDETLDDETYDGDDGTPEFTQAAEGIAGPRPSAPSVLKTGTVSGKKYAYWALTVVKGETDAQRKARRKANGEARSKAATDAIKYYERVAEADAKRKAQDAERKASKAKGGKKSGEGRKSLRTGRMREAVLRQEAAKGADRKKADKAFEDAERAVEKRLVDDGRIDANYLGNAMDVRKGVVAWKRENASEFELMLEDELRERGYDPSKEYAVAGSRTTVTVEPGRNVLELDAMKDAVREQEAEKGVEGGTKQARPFTRALHTVKALVKEDRQLDNAQVELWVSANPVDHRVLVENELRRLGYRFDGDPAPAAPKKMSDAEIEAVKKRFRDAEAEIPKVEAQLDRASESLGNAEEAGDNERAGRLQDKVEELETKLAALNDEMNAAEEAMGGVIAENESAKPEVAESPAAIKVSKKVPGTNVAYDYEKAPGKEDTPQRKQRRQRNAVSKQKAIDKWREENPDTALYIKDRKAPSKKKEPEPVVEKPEGTSAKGKIRFSKASEGAESVGMPPAVYVDVDGETLGHLVITKLTEADPSYGLKWSVSEWGDFAGDDYRTLAEAKSAVKHQLEGLTVERIREMDGGNRVREVQKWENESQLRAEIDRIVSSSDLQGSQVRSFRIRLRAAVRERFGRDISMEELLANQKYVDDYLEVVDETAYEVKSSVKVSGSEMSALASGRDSRDASDLDYGKVLKDISEHVEDEADEGLWWGADDAGIAQEIIEIVERVLPPGVSIKLERLRRDTGKYGLAITRFRRDTGKVEATIVIDSEDGIMKLQSARHEAIHILRAFGLITPREWRMVKRELKRMGALELFDIKDRYPEFFDKRGRPTDAAWEEAFAETFGWFGLTRDSGMAPFMTSVFERIEALVTRIREYLATKAVDITESRLKGDRADRAQASLNWVRAFERALAPRKKLVDLMTRIESGEVAARFDRAELEGDWQRFIRIVEKLFPRGVPVTRKTDRDTFEKVLVDWNHVSSKELFKAINYIAVANEWRHSPQQQKAKEAMRYGRRQFGRHIYQDHSTLYRKSDARASIEDISLRDPRDPLAAANRRAFNNLPLPSDLGAPTPLDQDYHPLPTAGKAPMNAPEPPPAIPLGSPREFVKNMTSTLGELGAIDPDADGMPTDEEIASQLDELLDKHSEPAKRGMKRHSMNVPRSRMWRDLNAHSIFNPLYRMSRRTETEKNMRVPDHKEALASAIKTVNRIFPRAAVLNQTMSQQDMREVIEIQQKEHGGDIVGQLISPATTYYRDGEDGPIYKVNEGAGEGWIPRIWFNPKYRILVTARHEIIHALRQFGLFSKAEWDYMVKTLLADDRFINAFDLRERYPESHYWDSEGRATDALQEEVVAEVFGFWGLVKGRGFAKRLDRLFKRAKHFLGNLSQLKALYRKAVRDADREAGRKTNKFQLELVGAEVESDAKIVMDGMEFVDSLIEFVEADPVLKSIFEDIESGVIGRRDKDHGPRSDHGMQFPSRPSAGVMNEKVPGFDGDGKITRRKWLERFTAAIPASLLTNEALALRDEGKPCGTLQTPRANWPRHCAQRVRLREFEGMSRPDTCARPRRSSTAPGALTG